MIKLNQSLLFVCALSLVACGDDDDDNQKNDAGKHERDAGDSGASDSGGGDASKSTGETVLVNGVVNDYMTQKPIKGMKFCLLDKPDVCDTTDADGKYTLPAPADSDVAVTADKSGYTPIVRLIHTAIGDTMVGPDYFFADSVIDDWQTKAGVTWDHDLGIAGFATFGTVNTTVTIDPKPGKLVYSTGDTNEPDPTADRAVPGQNVFGMCGIGGLWNLKPGDYEVTFKAQTGACTQTFPWAASGPDSSRFLAVAGRFSYGIGANCMGEPTETTTLKPYKDKAACVADDQSDEDAGVTVSADCQGCECNSCLSEANECRATAGCWDIVDCARRTGCMQMDCYMPDNCMAVVDGTPGGASGPGTMNAMAFETCLIGKCNAECF